MKNKNKVLVSAWVEKPISDKIDEVAKTQSRCRAQQMRAIFNQWMKQLTTP